MAELAARAARWSSAAAPCSPMDDRAQRAARRRRAGRRRPDRRGRPAPRGARRARVEIDATRRHRDAGHDRHPPAHVADGDARLRRRLDAHPVLRLVLPRARQALPPARTSTPGNLLAAIEALDAGVTTTVDWSHGLQTTEHADAAVDALQSVPGRFVLAYGNIQAGAVGVVRRRRSSATSSPADRRGRRHARLPDGLRRHRRPGVPRAGARSRWPASSASRSPPTPASGARPTTTASGSMHDARLHRRPRRSTCTPRRSSADSYHRIAATGGSVSVSTESEQSAGQGYPPTWALRAHGIPVSLSMDTSVWWSGDLFSAMRTTLGADRVPRAPRGARQGRDRHPLPPARRAGRRVGHPRRRPGARAARRDLGSLEVGQEGRRRADQERPLAGRRSRCSTRTGTSPSRPSAATCTPCSSTAGSSSTSTASSASTSPRPGARSRRPSSTCGRRSARRRGRKGMNPDIPETKSSTTPTRTPTTAARCRGGEPW